VGRDRQEKKVKQSKKVASDRDQALHHDGAAKTEFELKNEGK
jgi:hypothetical protein